MPALVEFVYRWPGGREEVRYRRQEDTEGDAKLRAEVAELQRKHGDSCPYFVRTAQQQAAGESGGSES